MSGRHRNTKRLRGARAVAAATALVVVTAGAWFGYRWLAEPTCTGEIRINVAAATEIAPAVSAAAEKWTVDGAAVNGTCVAVDVVSADPVDVAAKVATQHGVTLAGVGQASGAAELPDVWLPDSSTWLTRLRTAGASGFTPTNGGSVAHSPVVVAMPEPVAGRLGWPSTQLTWADLLKQVTTGSGLRAGTVDPARDPASLSGLLALTRAAAAGSDPAGVRATTTAVLRALATGGSVLRQDLIARFPRASDASSIASALNLAALSEENVIGYNAVDPPIRLAALYLDPTPMGLDYPYAVMPGSPPAKVAAAEGLYATLRGKEFRDLLAAHGLRASDGTWGNGFQAPQGAPSTVHTPRPGTPGATPAAPGGTAGTSSPEPTGTADGVLDPVVIDQALSTWTAVTQPGRMLAVIDVSGSMRQRVPTAGNATRQQVTVAAARRGLALFDDSWSLGLWTFSTDLVGEREYRELVPIGPLSSQRGRLEGALREVTPKENGGTGLYDTVLAAYRTVQDGWEAGRVNSVVLFTDGRNENSKGITEQKLLTELKRLADPERPIQVVIIGIGGDVNRDELDGITRVTGGGVFVTADPAKIGDILLKAIALRPAPR
ncbi:substrate-binding domain-containing protein [Micromonospora polyrhachis]|uniref:VWFA domain-containing protein n=1 Tax=Micromonospora polyrhachis TaxID=1282883 RepID=A0A7W7SVI1_9ACTN|nr:substrate-binding and VWA domain-containing protein [Micromonospora polyrhachis]MBB4960405.1 hypothetical protein [Micromonospora polyrhachis]